MTEDIKLRILATEKEFKEKWNEAWNELRQDDFTYKRENALRNAVEEILLILKVICEKKPEMR
jgi:hypothetical protein